jgi:hypothetical protein
MSKKTVVITETEDGKYRIENKGISEFALIGILECIVFDLKTAGRKLDITGTSSIEKGTVADNENNENNEKKPAAELIHPVAVSAVNKEQAEHEEIVLKTEAITSKPKTEDNQRASNTPDLRTRIGNAVKAIQALGGAAAEQTDLSKLTNDELQAELEDLTNQYKRLKSSRGQKK